MSQKYELVRQGRAGACRDGSIRTLHLCAISCLVAVVLVIGLSMYGSGKAWAVSKETSAEKAEHLRQQANPELFNA